MRLVLDTNVAVSALLWRGTPYEVLRTIRQREHMQLFFGGAILAELGELLGWLVPSKRLALPVVPRIKYLPITWMR